MKRELNLSDTDFWNLETLPTSRSSAATAHGNATGRFWCLAPSGLRKLSLVSLRCVAAQQTVVVLETDHPNAQEASNRRVNLDEENPFCVGLALEYIYGRGEQ